MNVTHEAVTKAQAKRWLDAAEDVPGFKNRVKYRSTIDRYRAQMNNGKWNADAGFILLATLANGVEYVIDGQHRLDAFIESDLKRFKFNVAHDVPQEVFQFVDQGKPRTLTDILSTKKWSNPGIMSSFGRMIWKASMNDNGDPRRNPQSDKMESEGNISIFLEDHQAEMMSLFGEYNADYLASIQRKGRGGKAYMLYFIREANRIDRDLLKEFLQFLADPIGVYTSKLKLKFAVEHADELRQQAKGDKGKVVKGKNKDLNDTLMQLYRFTWNELRQNKTRKTLAGFKAAFNKWSELKWQTLA